MARAFQIVPWVSKKDAIGKMALTLNHLLSSQGFETRIFTQKQRSLWGPLRMGLEGELPWAGADRPELCFYHHSVGSVAANRFLDWPAGKKVLIYHNITPPELVDPSRTAVIEDCRWGLTQLESLVLASDFQIGLSSLSCNQLKDLGAKQVLHAPYLVEERRFQRIPSEAPLVLMVGRVEPHKGFLEAVDAFEKIFEKYPRAKMVIAGDLRANPIYVSKIRERAAKLPIQLLGRVPNRRLYQLYEKAWVYLTLSEHEGFCVPLVEAMMARVPVVAYHSSAIPETLGKGGILLEDRTAKPVAEAVFRIFEDEKFRQEISKNQEGELHRYTLESFLDKLQPMLS